MQHNLSNPNEAQGRIMALYNQVASGYDQPALRFFSHVAQRLVELAQPQPGEHWLDAATGTGAAALSIADKVALTGQVIGVDLAAAMLTQAQHKVTRAGCSQVNLRLGDMAQLACADDTFDGVLCASALDLLPDPVGGLREWRRVLKPQGTVAFSSYAKPAFQPLQHLFETGVRHYAVGLPAPTRLAWPPINELELASDLLRNAGFAAIEVRGEQQGYYLANPEEWWAILYHSTARGCLDQLAPDVLTRFKTEHLAAVAEVTTARGIWLNVAAIFAVGQKK